uniref:Uncharacterized protein n=1 Tax=Ciona intestinalis TaxID=7719 RepID=H2Y138_CIOIN
MKYGIELQAAYGIPPYPPVLHMPVLFVRRGAEVVVDEPDHDGRLTDGKLLPELPLQ